MKVDIRKQRSGCRRARDDGVLRRVPREKTQKDALSIQLK
jgi:hypothetical protein